MSAAIVEYERPAVTQEDFLTQENLRRTPTQHEREKFAHWMIINARGESKWLIRNNAEEADFLIGILQQSEEDLMPSNSKTAHLNRLETHGYSLAYRRILEQLREAKTYLSDGNVSGCRTAILVGLDWVFCLRREAQARNAY